MLRFVLVIACLVFSVAEATIKVTSTPDLIIPVVTKSMTVSCTIDDYKNHGLSEITKIELAYCKNKACVREDLLILAGVYNEPDAINVKGFNVRYGFNDDSRANGNVGSWRSFLTHAWFNLESDHTGRFKCIFHGKTQTGKPDGVLWDFVDVMAINQGWEGEEGVVPEPPMLSVDW